MPDIITLGELLIDFVPTVSGVTLIEAPAFKKAPGGAPANVAVGLSRLGVPTGFMGKVGDDAFGHFLAQTLEQAGVDISALRFSAEARTALAFVSLRADGEREFMFYRHPSADMLYAPDEVDGDYIRSAHILHYGSISLITEPSRSATLCAVETAKAAGLRISYDPNLRLNLWPNAEAAKRGLLSGWPLAQVIKVSEEELAFLTGADGAHAVAPRFALAGCDLWQSRQQIHHAQLLRRGARLCRKSHGHHWRWRWFRRRVAQRSARTSQRRSRREPLARNLPVCQRGRSHHHDRTRRDSGSAHCRSSGQVSAIAQVTRQC